MWRRAEGEPNGGHDGPPRVMVVNDDPDACEVVARILEHQGYEVSRSFSQHEAVAKLTHDVIDCVVLDLTTGGIGGNLKLLDSIRSADDARVAHTRVVLVAKQAVNRMFSWQQGVDAFLVRPFHADELLRDVAEVIERPEDERLRHRRAQLDEASAAPG